MREDASAFDGFVVPALVDTWLVRVYGVAPLVRWIHACLDADDDAGAEAMRVCERPWSLPATIAAGIGHTAIVSYPHPKAHGDATIGAWAQGETSFCAPVPEEAIRMRDELLALLGSRSEQ